MKPKQLRAVIAAARAGREEAYRQLLATYGPRLYGYFFRATGAHHDAEDLLGEVMLRLVRNLGDYDDRGRFEPWLFRIAANLVRDRIRRTRTSPSAASLESDEPGTGLRETLAGADRPVDERLLRAELGEKVDAALQRLDERSRQMLLLRHFGDMSFKEIAEVFDCPLGTVLARVHRATRMLRRILASEDEPL